MQICISKNTFLVVFAFLDYTVQCSPLKKNSLMFSFLYCVFYVLRTLTTFAMRFKDTCETMHIEDADVSESSLKLYQFNSSMRHVNES